jgi:hypothetical protein
MLSNNDLHVFFGFSILKYLKNRLRSTLNESKLEAFVIMSIEKDTLFNINKLLIT